MTGLAALLLAIVAGPAQETNKPGPPAAGTPTRARVVIVEHPDATEAFKPRLDAIRPMVDRGLSGLTGKATAKEAWLSLVSTQDTVGIKVLSAPGTLTGTRPAVAEAVVQSLLAAGLPPRQIIVWDREIANLRLAGFDALAERYGVRVAGSLESGYDTNHFYDTPLLGQLVWGDAEYGQKGDGLGRKSYVSKLVTQQITKLINLTPLLNHNLVGVSGNLYSLALGSVDNTLRFANEASRLATAIPDLYALPSLGDRVVLNIVDALLAQYEGAERTLLHYSAPLNQLRFSTDPVALDVLSIQELERQREAAGGPKVTPHLALYQNATAVWIGVSDPNRIQVDWLR